MGLGGSITGSGHITIDDELEVRPGLFTASHKGRTENEVTNNKSDFKVQPLSCQVKGLMTGKTKLTNVTKGGLVAIQTTLCPSTCANNGFVGAVAGPPGTLPPIWGPTLLLEKVERIDIVGLKKEKDIEARDGLKKGSPV